MSLGKFVAPMLFALASSPSSRDVGSGPLTLSFEDAIMTKASMLENQGQEICLAGPDGIIVSGRMRFHYPKPAPKR